VFLLHYFVKKELLDCRKVGQELWDLKLVRREGMALLYCY